MRLRTHFARALTALDRPLAALLVAAVLAGWLLYHPALVQGLGWPWRGALVLLGVWALGGAFARPLAMSVGERGPWRLAGSAWSRSALPLFTLLLAGRGLLG